MRKILTLLFLLPVCMIAQNAAPTVTNVTAVADTSNQKVTFTYDLNDPDNSTLEVWIQVSADSGRTWQVWIDSLSGDAGMSVSPGTGKNLVWWYQNSTVQQYGSGLTGMRARIIADDHEMIDLNDLLALVDSARIMQHLAQIEGVKHRTAGLSFLNQTGDSLMAWLDAEGYAPYKYGGNFSGYMGQNIFGRRSGTRSDSSTCIISGHYDTVSNAPGADDNGTGVVTVLEAMKVLSGIPTKRSLRFAFFDLEEAGLVGSTDYVISGMPSWESPHSVVNMDAMGYYSNQVNTQTLPNGFNQLFPAAYDSVVADSNRGNFLTSIVNTASHSLDTLFRNIVNTYTPDNRVISVETPGTGTLTPDLRRSDHAPFWDIGVPAIFFTDGANFRNPNYHTAGDSLATIDPAFLLRNIRGIVLLYSTLAEPEHSGMGESNSFVFGLPTRLSPPARVSDFGLKVSPNPNSGQFRIEFALPVSENVKVEILDHHGRLVKVVHKGMLAQGSHVLSLEAELPADHYVCKLQAGQAIQFFPVVIIH